MHQLIGLRNFSLSHKVNLPARLVIIRSPLQNGRCIDLSTYLQMVRYSVPVTKRTTLFVGWSSWSQGLR